MKFIIVHLVRLMYTLKHLIHLFLQSQPMFVIRSDVQIIIMVIRQYVTQSVSIPILTNKKKLGPTIYFVKNSLLKHYG